MTTKKKLNMTSHGKVKVLDVPCFLVRYTDGHGETSTRLGVVVGPEVRFVDDKMLSKPAQKWLRDDIFKALDLDLPEDKEEKTATNVLENQV